MKKTLIRFILILSFIAFTSHHSWCQVSNMLEDRNAIRVYEKHINQPDARFHSSMRPYKAADVYKIVYPDSLYHLKRIENAEKKFNKLINVVGYEDLLSFDENGLIRHYELDTIETTIYVKKGKTKIEYKPRKFHISINPILGLQFGYEQVDGEMLRLYRDLGFGKNRNFFDNKTLSYNLRGIAIKADIGTKFSIYTSFMENQARFAGYILGAEDINDKSAVPGEGKSRVFKQRGFDFSSVIGYLTYRPNKHFEVELGHGKHFIGDGYRSLLLSDNSFVYPYLKTTTSFWRIRYTNIFTEFQNDINAQRDFALGHERKLGSFIYVSADLSKWFQLGLFEGIIWPRSGTNGNNEFNFNYLNPIIGIRGFQKLNANTVYGLNMKVLAPRNFVFYGQIMINQLASFSSYENRTGYQGGVKYFDAFGVENLNIQLEYNRVRPYSYTYGDSAKHYTHYAQALAHPLGANFSEFVGIIDYRWKRVYTELKSNIAMGGIDAISNYGGNIFTDNSSAVKTTNVSVGQGEEYSLLHNEIKVGYIINPKINLRAELKLVNRVMKIDNNTYLNNMFYFGISTQLFNKYYDFAFSY